MMLLWPIVILGLFLIYLWKRLSIWQRVFFVLLGYVLPIGVVVITQNTALGLAIPIGYGITWVLISRRYSRSASPSSEKPAPQAPAQSSIAVHLQPETEKEEGATEEISIPPGVTIKVKRSRTVEHTVNVNWSIAGGGSIDMGVRQIISASIRGEIEQTQGRTYQQTETIEYEVELNGEKSDRYELIWTDVWRKGVAEVQHGGQTRILPFQFRERAELHVTPLGTGSRAG
ncbi:hypothetical protein ACFL9T_22725 [Thermodesulfobacteriota bacterium]